MTITLGLWALPFFATVVTWIVLVGAHRYDGRHSYGYDFIAFFKLLFAVVLTLVYWLIWALVT